MTSITQSPEWQQLSALAEKTSGTHLRDWFAQDEQRFSRFSITDSGWLLDYSKQRINSEIMSALHALWQRADVTGGIRRMRAGEALNHTEGRAVLHTALRQRSDDPVMVDGRNVIPDVRKVLARMESFCAEIHSGRRRGATGKTLTSIVNIGIGGSDLGPKMAVQALSAQRVPGLTMHFVSNIDGAHLATALAQCDPESTLFVIASKTFTTQETMQNAESARAWLVAALGDAAVAKHFIALSTNLEKVAKFGIDPENVFEFWDWVGGRFSMWSAIGLSLALAVGMANFRQMLAGADAMDQHFFNTPVAQNLPATLALLEVWNTDFLGAETRGLFPYSQSLDLLTRYLQQLEMESNGKRVDRNGQSIPCATATIVWGESGTNGQHAFYQLIHQGGRLIPCEFIALAEADYPLPGHHEKLLAHCLAQSEALMRGKTLAEAQGELNDAAPKGGAVPKGDAVPPGLTFTADDLAPYKVFPGNQPSTTLIMPRIDAFTLGQLIAMYEHKVFALGMLWNLNSFDQWGVEYGKQLAGRLLPIIEGKAPASGLDSSTAGLIKALRQKRTPTAN